MVRNKFVLATLLALTTATSRAANVGDSVRIDTIRYNAPLVTSKIQMAVRTYGDSIMLRWVPEDYASWKYLCDFGVNILRLDPDDNAMKIDTVAYALKPLSLDGFKAKYHPDDNNARVVMGLLYGEGRLREGQTQAMPGTMEADMEFNTEQDISFAFAMMIADWRRDLSQDMAVGFVDRHVQPGKAYQYYVQPTRWENGGAIIFEPGVVERVVNRPYSPRSFSPQMTDTVSGIRRHLLGWWDRRHSSFEVERRAVTDQNGRQLNEPWQRLNSKPYVSMIEQPEGDDYCAFGDSVPQFGVYEYRIMAHDPFGELTQPSPAFRVNVYDNEPPRAPQLTRIYLDYPGETLQEKVLADFRWRKDTIESDMAGYILYYAHGRDTGGEWITLVDSLISPSDTSIVIDVTKYRTGMVTLAAVDHSGNEGRSFAQLLELRDYKAPEAPDSLRARVVVPNFEAQYGNVDTGYAYVILDWKENLADDDIMYYDVAFANDTTHTFLLRNEGGIRETMFIDTLALNVNQKYIYYKVRAVDYSTNIGAWSDYIRVLRPHVTPPTQPHLHSSSVSEQDGIHMEWVVGTDADMDYHLAYRGRGDNGEWELIGRYDHDSLVAKNYTITIDDRPPYDRQERYFYYVESHNSSPFTSKSLAVSFLYQGPKIWPVDIRLSGAYIASEQQTRIVWDVPQLPFDAPYYYCVYRRAEGQKRFEYMGNVMSDTTEYTDQRLLREGQTAEYYVRIQWRDGRQSTQSNVVTVKR